jgi:hypothetical protein
VGAVSAPSIRIVNRPIGEAPEWVRDAWIGVVLPLRVRKQKVWRGVGVLSGPHTFWAHLSARLTGRTQRIPGYVVDVRVAVEILARQNAAAADWWRTNAHELLARGSGFIFDTACCEVVVD